MSDTPSAADIIARGEARRAARRGFLRNAGVISAAGLGALSAAHVSAPVTFAQGTNPTNPTDPDVLNFALNLEYLEAEFYLLATRGTGLAAADTTGTGTQGSVIGGRQVPNLSSAVQQYAAELAADEEAHVRFLRQALGSAAVARPQINFTDAFTAAARAAGLVPSGGTFDAFANENNFLLASFIFEDVGVTAYKGGSRFIANPAFLTAAAGILAVEAYHAGNIRTVLFGRGLSAQANAISNARDALDGTSDLDQGITDASRQANIVPSDAFGVAFSRTFGQVLNVVYLTSASTTQGGFFPAGVNGTIRTSAQSA